MQVLDDLRDANFGDKRLTKRLLSLVERLGPDPSTSFPSAARTDAELEATYRFLGNESVTPAGILAPHITATVQRATKAGVVLALHDTTEMSFSTDREGFGPIDGGRGFFAHFALAVRPDTREPLGVLGLHTYVRKEEGRGKHPERRPEDERESFRWQHLASDVGALFERDRVVHVMDSEADSFVLLEKLTDAKQRFVIRLKHNRAVVGGDGELRLDETLQGLEGCLEREVILAVRAPRLPKVPEKKGRRNPTRPSRMAKLEFTATSVELKRPEYLGKGPGVRVNVVHVREPNPPAGCEPVDWKLVTTDAIESPQDIARIVDVYRARWVIEEFFKALKTGCAFEKRQLESMPVLLNALAVFTPIASELLRLRSLARATPEACASAAFRNTLLLVLQRHKDTRLRPDATTREAMLAVARLGGHITNNGEPGWIVLGRGYERLLTFEEGMLLAPEVLGTEKGRINP
jgi:hypothetical protein